jgi:integrase
MNTSSRFREMPAGAMLPVLTPHDRGRLIGDYYGKEVHLDGAVWHLNDPGESNVRLDWAKLGFTHRGMIEATADFIVERIQSSSTGNVVGHFHAIRQLKKLPTFKAWSNPMIMSNRKDLTHVWFYEARDVVGMSRGDLSHLQRWFTFCARREDSSVNLTSAGVLDAITIGSQPKGVAVLTSDPKGGPLNDAETTALLQSLAAAREKGSIDIAAAVAVWLCIILGPNPRMLALMREEDFRRVDGRHAEISVPRIKGKDAHLRTRFRIRKLDEHSARMIEQLIAFNRKCREDLPWSDELVGRPYHEYAMHRTSKSISRLIMKTVVKLRVVSPRTGEYLKAGPRRFRYTFATRLLREGAAPNIVADLLDHSDLQTIRSYLNLRGDLVEKLDFALAMEMAPMAQAFMGVLVTGEAQAIRGGTRASRIFDPSRGRNEALGTCGSRSFCGLAAPRACYTCF